MKVARFCLLLFALTPVFAWAQSVLLLSTGDSSLDSQTKAVVEAGGFTVTVGSPYTSFTGAELSGINVVLLLPNYNWAAGDMPLAGQTALANFVSAGGGLITSEWTNWKVGSGSFSTLSTALPVVATTQYTGGGAITYTALSSNAALNAGLGASFSFTGDNFAGVESYFTPKSGATAYFSSSGGAGGAGLVGWSYGSGRVLQFSTVMGPSELADSNYATLMRNAVTWTAVPEPSICSLLAVGLGVLCWLARAQRR